MNTWIFTGNLGKDCELRQSQNGSTIVTFSVGVTSGYGDNKKTTWANCALFGKRAEGRLPEFLKKGQQVCVSGEVTLDKWQDQQGQERQALKVVVDKIDLTGGQQQQPQQGYQQPQQQQPNQYQQQPQAQPQPQAGGFDDFDDGIPF